MANKQNFYKLLSAYPYVTPPELAAHDAAVAATWLTLNPDQQMSVLANDYRARIWYAGFLAGQQDLNAEQKEHAKAWERLCFSYGLPNASHVDAVAQFLTDAGWKQGYQQGYATGLLVSTT